ncbi:MAG: hypothetical protein DRI86_02970 [Bacteroidetes bacterium]|nr:MAG: hypothetical protein DRI86_02970 [Bacteroidota bacterium]
MAKFLEKVAKELLLLSKDELRDALIILPNRRAKLYLTRHIANNVNEPIWSPEIIAINDFVYNNLKITETDNIELILKLFEVHKKIDPKNAQSLDQFTTWADLLLSDFNEIDLFLVSAKHLFSYLKDAKEIAQWNLEPDKLTEQERSYLKFYASLEKYYNEFKKTLLTNNTAYQGMAYRLLSEKANKLDLDYSHIYIAGFNSLSPSEELIFKKIKENFNAKMFWDIDRYYFENKSHEAGISLRRELKNEDITKVDFIGNYLSSNAKKIDIYGIEGNLAQVKFAAQLIEKQLEDTNLKLEDTAIVLANEELMIPMISSIPESVDKFNLTMSYPLRLHPSYDLVMNILDLFKNYNFEAKEQKELSIYYKFFLNFVQHPYIKEYLNSGNSESTNNIISKINKDNISKIIINKEFINVFGKPSDELLLLFDILKGVNNNVNSVLDITINIFELLENQESESKPENAYFNHFIDIFTNLKDLLKEVNFIKKLTTLSRWVQNTMNQAPIPFSGEPLAGLQVMGMLETRTLDFKNIIILSVNEGILPKTKPYQSFILFDIKKEFNMPLPSENDSIMAYHFYRLLQRADNVNLIYNISPGQIQGNEMSRFIKQIELEMPLINPKIEISHQKVQFKFQSEDKVQDISVQKSPLIIEKIKNYAINKGFSPSSLNNYKKCSYFFYLQKIVGLKTDEVIEEQMAYNTQGTIIHETLEDFYKEYINKNITVDDLKKSKKKILNIFINKITEEFENLNTKTGRGLITKKILEQYLKNYINNEIKYLEKNECHILGLEEKLSKELIFNINKEKIKISFGGSADKIDKNKNTIRIVDYKTGKVEPRELSISIFRGFDQWENMFSEKYDKAFQLMMYAWMYWDNKPVGYYIQSGISALKNNGEYYPLELYKEYSISEENISRFEEDLKLLIETLFDKETPFKQRENDRICINCEFKDVCER